MNLAHKEQRETPLLIAAQEGHKDIVEILLKVEDIDVNQTNIHGKTPLWWAVYEGHEEIVYLLHIMMVMIVMILILN